MKILLIVFLVLGEGLLRAQTMHLPHLPDPGAQKINEEVARRHNLGIAKCLIELDKETAEYAAEMLCGPADKRTGELGHLDNNTIAWKTTSIYDFSEAGFVVAGYANGKLFTVVSSKNIAEAIRSNTFFEKNQNPPGTAFSLAKSLRGDR